MWDRTWLSHASFVAMMVLATTLILGWIVGVTEVLARLTPIQGWIRAALGVMVVGATLAVLAFVLGTHEYSGYEWPGFSGIGMVLFQEHRMLLFATIPLPIACCICGGLVLWRVSPKRTVGT
jgi:hypothetical protein